MTKSEVFTYPVMVMVDNQIQWLQLFEADTLAYIYNLYSK